MLEMFFFKYYTHSQILALCNNCMDDVYIAWKIAMHKVWRLPWTTHYKLLTHLAGVMDPELWFSKKTYKFIKITLNSDNIIVRKIIAVSLNGTHSIMGGKWRHLRSKYGMEECNGLWDRMCKECESVTVCEQMEKCVARGMCDIILFNIKGGM